MFYLCLCATQMRQIYLAHRSAQHNGTVKYYAALPVTIYLIALTISPAITGLFMV